MKSAELFNVIAFLNELKVDIPHAIEVFDYCLENFVINHDKESIYCDKTNETRLYVNCGKCVCGYKRNSAFRNWDCILSNYNNTSHHDSLGRNYTYQIMESVSILLNRYDEFKKS